MAMLIAELALSGSRKADGSVNTGGRVFLTQIGSETAVLGYQDRDMLASHPLNSGGILLDAAGKAAIYVASPCTIRIEDAAGSQTASYVAAPVSAAELVEVTNSKFMGVDSNGQSVVGARTYLDTVLTNFGVSLGGLDGAYLGAFGTTSRSVYKELDDLGLNVKRFGATGDGTTDDTAAINAALSVAASASLGRPRRVFLPAGTYVISATLTVSANTQVLGEGPGQTIIKNASTTIGAISGSGTGILLEDFAITSAAPNTNKAISLSNNAGLAVVNRVSTTGHRKGVDASGGIVLRDSTFTCDSNAAARGIYMGLGDLSMYSVTAVAGAAGTGCECDSIFTVVAVECNIGNVDAVGYAMTGTAGRLTLIGGRTKSVTMASTARGFANYGCQITGSPQVTDTTPAGTSWQFDVAGGGSCTPDQSLESTIKVRATSAGNIGINSGVKIWRGRPVVYLCFNNSGGAATFVFSADFANSGSPAPGNGLCIGITYVWNETQARYNEVGRSAAYAP